MERHLTRAARLLPAHSPAPRRTSQPAHSRSPLPAPLPAPLAVPGPASRPAQPHRAYVEMIMGLPFSVHIRGDADVIAEAASVQQVWDELRRLDQVFSTFRPDSDISRIDRGEITVIHADPSVAEVLDLADQARSRTADAFDIRYGRRLDPAGIAKGWAASRAAALLDVPGVDWYLNAGGDIALRSSGSGAPWRVGIEHPEDSSQLLAVLQLADGAVATSGRAHRGQHIVDPTTGIAATGVAQATVCGPDLVWADVFATAIVAAPRLLHRKWQLPQGYEFLQIADDGSATGSPGMAALLRERNAR